MTRNLLWRAIRPPIYICLRRLVRMVSRVIENYREGIRKYALSQLPDYVSCQDTALLVRWVDEDVLNKARFAYAHRNQRATARAMARSGDADDMEKYREMKGGRFSLDSAEFTLDDSFEKMYFDHYGEGYNGEPAMNRPGEAYKCPCGVSMEMGMKTAPPYCPVCHRPTPIGRMMEDNFLHR